VGRPAGSGNDGNSGNASAQRRDDGSWLVSGSLATDDLRELLKLDELPNEEEGDYYTLAGMLIEMLGHIPVEGESATWHGLKFEVVDLDGARIDKVLVSSIAKDEQASETDLDDG
ncbi:MAG: transporter associated domain-containing protein, partial [Pseudomonadota bacterium]